MATFFVTKVPPSWLVLALAALYQFSECCIKIGPITTALSPFAVANPACRNEDIVKSQ
jgi:hypothetical protein